MNLDDLRTSRSAVVTVSQAAAIFGVDVRAVSRTIRNGELAGLRLGRRVLIPRLPGWPSWRDRPPLLSEAHELSSSDR